MARSTRIKGSIVPIFKLSSLSPAASADFSDDLISINLGEGDGAEAVSFSDFALGLSPLSFELEATMSFDVGSLFDFTWKNSGKTGVTFVYARFGNAVATAAQPHFTGTLSMPPRQGFEAAASESDSDTIERTFQVDTIELKITA